MFTKTFHALLLWKGEGISKERCNCVANVYCNPMAQWENMLFLQLVYRPFQVRYAIRPVEQKNRKTRQKKGHIDEYKNNVVVPVVEQ